LHEKFCSKCGAAIPAIEQQPTLEAPPVEPTTQEWQSNFKAPVLLFLFLSLQLLPPFFLGMGVNAFSDS